MRKRSSARMLLLSTLLAVGGCRLLGGGEADAPTPVPDRIILTWSDDPASTQTVTWRTSPSVAPGVAEVAVATDGPAFASQATRFAATTQPLDADLGPALYHTAVMTGLAAGTKYAYRVGDGENWSEWSHFVTASEEPEPFSLIYFGDAQNDIKAHWSRVVREAFKDAPRAAFLLHAGDLVDRANADAEWGEWFYSAGWILRTMPSVATPGNHEYGGGQLSRHWAPTFEFPRNGPAGLEESAYWFDYQGVRIVSLNSNTGIDVQTAWLDEVLRDNPARWTVVTMHHPIYSTAKNRDNKELRDAWQPVFDRHGVDIVLQGHDHAYGRTGLMRHGDGHAHEHNVPTGAMVQAGSHGTVYVVSVSGPKMYDVGQQMFMRSTSQNRQLYQILSFEEDALRYAAYTATGRLYDAFTLRHRPDGGNELIEGS